MIFPAGVNDHGQPINLQLQGKEFDDLKLLGFAYAFEAKANGHVAAGDHPGAAVRDLDDRHGGRHGAGDAVADARRSGVVRRVHAGRREGLHRVDDRQRHLHRRRRGADACPIRAT